MATVRFQVPAEIWKRMNEADVDWPARLREFVVEELERAQMRAALARVRAFREKHADRMQGYSMSQEVIRSRYEDH